MKGIILAGGTGSRLYPITKGISKHLLAVYDKPMIYYPLSVLMLSDIRDILIITTNHDYDHFLRTLGDGSEYGINLSYKIQATPDGLAQAFIIGEDFIGNDSVCLVLGDNIFWGQGFTNVLQKTISQNQGATIFGYQVNDPERFGVVEFDSDQKAISIEEKPKKPKSNYAITGLYFYDNNVIEMAKKVKPSNRGELEISSINQMYLDQGNLNVELLGRGFVWLDTGTFESLLEAAMFAETIEKRQGYKIACLEEIAWRNGWLNDDQLLKLASKHIKNSYGQYLKSLVQ